MPICFESWWATALCEVDSEYCKPGWCWERMIELGGIAGGPRDTAKELEFINEMQVLTIKHTKRSLPIRHLTTCIGAYLPNVIHNQRRANDPRESSTIHRHSNLQQPSDTPDQADKQTDVLSTWPNADLC